MSKQQKNSAFVKMLKEFPKVFGRVSFRERLMLRTAFDYINEEVIADIKANCDFAIEGRDIKIMELEKENAELKNVERMALYSKLSDQLTKATEIIKKFSMFVNNEIEYDPEYPQEHTDLWNELVDQSEQFIKELGN